MCQSLFFNKAASLIPATLLKKILKHCLRPKAHLGSLMLSSFQNQLEKLNLCEKRNRIHHHVYIELI